MAVPRRGCPTVACSSSGDAPSTTPRSPRPRSGTRPPAPSGPPARSPRPVRATLRRCCVTAACSWLVDIRWTRASTSPAPRSGLPLTTPSAPRSRSPWDGANTPPRRSGTVASSSWEATGPWTARSSGIRPPVTGSRRGVWRRRDSVIPRRGCPTIASWWWALGRRQRRGMGPCDGVVHARRVARRGRRLRPHGDAPGRRRGADPRDLRAPRGPPGRADLGPDDRILLRGRDARPGTCATHRDGAPRRPGPGRGRQRSAGADVR